VIFARLDEVYWLQYLGTQFMYDSKKCNSKMRFFHTEQLCRVFLVKPEKEFMKTF